MADKYERENYYSVAKKHGGSKLFFIAILFNFLALCCSFVELFYDSVIKFIETEGPAVFDLIGNFFLNLISFFVGLWLTKLLYDVYKYFRDKGGNIESLKKFYLVYVISAALTIIINAKLLLLKIPERDNWTLWLAAIVMILVLAILNIIMLFAIRKTLKFGNSVIDGEPKGKVSNFIIITLILAIIAYSTAILSLTTYAFESNPTILNELEPLRQIDNLFELIASIAWLILIATFKKDINAMMNKYSTSEKHKYNKKDRS